MWESLKKLKKCFPDRIPAGFLEESLELLVMFQKILRKNLGWNFRRNFFENCSRKFGQNFRSNPRRNLCRYHLKISVWRYFLRNFYNNPRRNSNIITSKFYSRKSTEDIFDLVSDHLENFFCGFS